VILIQRGSFLLFLLPCSSLAFRKQFSPAFICSVSVCLFYWNFKRADSLGLPLALVN